MFSWWKKTKGEKSKEDAVVNPPPISERDSRPRIKSIIFTVDRLPALKKTLAMYEKDIEIQSEKRANDRKLKELLGPLVQEFMQYFVDVWRNQEKDDTIKRLPFKDSEDRALRIFGQYAGYLFSRLKELRENGWDGNGLSYDAWGDNFRYQAVSELKRIIFGLEAVGGNVVMEMPEEMAGNYEASLLYRIRENAKETEPDK
ncbi:MAG: hypothetical protein PHN44_01165 [Candidatus Marinimicrobia bacterium]|nr:hypothetical protein [Candidatus Neomarinimicrobiota bacterium]MDD5539097.1 hypothetical protein [Candidatus Neomarinimicrobiota bacterium]